MKSRNETVRKAEPGDVVQINENYASFDWTGCLLICNEVKTWGILAGMRIPMKGTTHLRIPHGGYDIIGKAALIEAADDEP